jgi:SOS-response transcriptional repressor LexA
MSSYSYEGGKQEANMHALAEEWLPEATVEIPLRGEVAAGQPFEAYEIQDTLAVPAGLWTSRKVFALRVRGNSMIEEGIHDGDYLIVEPATRLTTTDAGGRGDGARP